MKRKTRAANNARMAGKIAKVRPLNESRVASRSGAFGMSFLALLGNMRSFTISDVVSMMDDDQVALGFDYLKIPIFHAPIAVKTSKPEAYAWTCDLYQRIWTKLIPKLDMFLGYGWSLLEPLYRKDTSDLRYWDFSDFDIAPSIGSVPWVCNDRMAFAAVDSSNTYSTFQSDLDNFNPDVILEGPGRYRPSKALWLCNDPLRSRWYGRSVLRAAHLRWKAKNMPDGLIESLFKAAYKCSFSGFLVRYPAGQSVVTAVGEVKTSEEYADLILQAIKNGSGIRLPAAIKDAPGWAIEEYAKNLVDLQKLIAPLDYVDRGILRGMGIPDDILNQGDKGGYSRSLVSIDAFYARGETRAGHILPSVTDYIVQPLVRQRYGDDCEVWAKIMPAPRPGEDGGGGGDQNGNGIPDALEGSMGGEGDMQGNDDGIPGNGQQQRPQLPWDGIQHGDMDRQTKPTRFSVSMAAIAPKKEYSSTQLNLDINGKQLIEKITSLISKDDLSEKGIEDKPHITVKYGLHTDSPVDVICALDECNVKKVEVTLGGLSVFDTNPEYDVLKIDVESPALRKLNKAISKLKNTDEFPEYKPHLTLAYMKKGRAQKYADMKNPLEGAKLVFDTVMFSDKRRNKFPCPLNESSEAN